MLPSVLAYGLALVLFFVALAAGLRARSERRKSLFSRHEALLAQIRLEALLNATSEAAFVLDSEQRVVGRLPPLASRLLGRDGVAGTTLSDLLSGSIPDVSRLQTVSCLEALLQSQAATNPLADTTLRGARVTVEFTRIDVHGLMAGILVKMTARAAADTASVAAPEAAPAPEAVPAPADTAAPTLRPKRGDPAAMTSFLQDAGSKMAQVRAMLRMPARTEQAFREKLSRIQDLLVVLRLRATELSLDAVVQKTSDFAQMLLALHAKPALTGNDFLPLAVKLDDLFSHIALMGEMSEPDVDSDDDETQQPFVATQLLTAPARPDLQDLSSYVRDLASETATEAGREVSVVAVGLEDVPADLRVLVSDVLGQLVRNAVRHGLESPDERTSRNKPRAGTCVVQFDCDDRNAYNLSFQDDGRGLDYDRIKSVAIEQGVLTEGVAERIDPRKLASLIFRPGFSTALAGPDHIRGVGMDLVRERVHALGGKVGVATKPGEFTRFRIMLPRSQRQVA